MNKRAASSMLNKSLRGFTIVELLIVIVVIAILAAISITAFTGIQQRARDTERQSDIKALATMLSLYKVDKGNYAEQTCGYVGGSSTGSGWLNGAYNTGSSINKCLTDAGLMEKELVDPSGDRACPPTPAPAVGNCNAYMKISCPAGTWLAANLETKPRTGTEGNGIACSIAAQYSRDYGMNYFVKVN